MSLAFGLVVGLDQEATLASRFGRVAIGGGTFEGALKAAEVLVELGATALLSFGVAGGLDPALKPGDVIAASDILVDGETFRPTLIAPGVTQGRMLGARQVVRTVADKAALWSETRAQCVDMESGAVALTARKYRLPFGALRAVCDPAGRTLPPVALTALQDGSIQFRRVLASLLRQPGQLPALMALAQDARKARIALSRLRMAPMGQ